MCNNKEGYLCSICIITRDEAAKLEKCLKRLGSLNVEIIVLDTGSKDRSKEVARGLGAKVHDFVWIDDFSAARNVAAGLASSDLILMIDTDEYLEISDRETLESMRGIGKIAAGHAGAVGQIHRVSDYRMGGRRYQDSEWIGRLYDRRHFTYQGKIHEQIVPLSDPDAEFEYYHVPVTISHDGYDMDEKAYAEKARRNERLLRKEAEKSPEDPYLWFQLGKSCDAMGRFRDAAINYGQALDLRPDLRLNYVRDMIVSYGYDLLELKMVPEALEALLFYAEVEPGYMGFADYVFLLGLLYMNTAAFDKAVETFLAAAKLPPDRTVGTNSFLAYYNAGVIREVQGRKSEALDLYGRCGDYDRAVEAIERVRI